VRSLFPRRPPRPVRLLATLLALLVTLQGVGASVLATLGPLHTHKIAPTFVVLDDFRRGTTHVWPSERASERHGHSHGALRHHHAAGDASMNLAPGEAAQGLDGDDAGFATTLGFIVALVAAPLVWLQQAPRDVRAARHGWVPRTHLLEPFERPPRSA
jgi:hypothetical protein